MGRVLPNALPGLHALSSLSTLLIERRRPVVLFAHFLIWVSAYVGAFLLRFDFEVPSAWLQPTYALAPLPLFAIRALAYERYGLFHGMWKYTGQRDLESLVIATGLPTVVYGIPLLLSGTDFPRSVLLVEALLAIAMATGLRVGVRTLAQAAQSAAARDERRRLVLVGAGDTGEAMLRAIHRTMPDVEPVGILDDDPHKQGMRVHGVEVVGSIDDAPELLAQLTATEVVIATPSATGPQMRRIVARVSQEGVVVRTVPSAGQLLDGRVSVSHLREVHIEDLLGRDPVELDNAGITSMITGQVVLVTGAGGSIGSELCRQVARFGPRALVLLEQAENALYHIHRELSSSYPDVPLMPRICDVGDRTRLDMVFGETRPAVVLHAAAHKHVPMMEWNPGEAVKNNVGGTMNVSDAAHDHGVKRFVMISTDKAVNPTSVMGCTKRVAELYVQSQAERSDTTFVTVRFGNVLGSNGSVIPLFKKQIEEGGPVTVTHPDMQRFFMTIPEASQLVLEAGAMGSSGEIYVLDMGKPVRITQLAEDLIRLSGLQPGSDIEIVYTGMRPGEKLFEELAIDGENATKTKHPKIFIGKGRSRRFATMRHHLEHLLSVVQHADADSVRMSLQNLVPRYTVTPAPTQRRAVGRSTDMGPQTETRNVRHAAPMEEA